MISFFMSRDHNATSYSTETLHQVSNWFRCVRRDHNATSYSTETFLMLPIEIRSKSSRDHNATSYSTETENGQRQIEESASSRDHNATSYSTETFKKVPLPELLPEAEIITLRAIALKLVSRSPSSSMVTAEIITLRAIALKLFVYDDVQDYELDTQRS